MEIHMWMENHAVQIIWDEFQKRYKNSPRLIGWIPRIRIFETSQGNLNLDSSICSSLLKFCVGVSVGGYYLVLYLEKVTSVKSTLIRQKSFSLSGNETPRRKSSFGVSSTERRPTQFSQIKIFKNHQRSHLNGFQFRWLNINFNTVLSISIILSFNHLNWNWS